MRNKVIYTCLTGTYDSLLQPLAVSDEFDYICFTDNVTAPSIGVWQLRPIPFCSRNKILLSRYAKILPHMVLPEYDYSVYLDANIQIVEPSFYDYVNREIVEGHLIAQVPHLGRNCVYQEIYACWHMGLISILADVYLRYKLHRTGMPENYGLMENNLIFRRHNVSFVKTISEMWWQDFRRGIVQRDQLLLMPLYWKYGFMPDLLFGDKKNTRNVSFVKWNPHKKHRKRPAPKSRFELYLMRISNGAERRGWI